MPRDRNTDDAQDLFTRGHKAMTDGQYQEAVECFSRAIRLRPDVSAGYRYVHIDGGDITVTARGDSPVREGGQFLTKWSQTILRSVTDSLEIVSDGVAEVTFRLGRGVVT